MAMKPTPGDRLERHHFQIARALTADEDRDPGRDHERRGGRKEDQDRVLGAVAGEPQDGELGLVAQLGAEHGGEDRGELEHVGGSPGGFSRSVHDSHLRAEKNGPPLEWRRTAE